MSCSVNWIFLLLLLLLLSLKVRQDQWKQEEAERIANMPDPSVPAGHALMPRDQQRETLANLQTSK